MRYSMPVSWPSAQPLDSGFSGTALPTHRFTPCAATKPHVLAALRQADMAGWRGPAWRYYRDFDPNLASIRNQPEFKAVFADIERDMAQQRARLAARPKDAALEPIPESGWPAVGCQADIRAAAITSIIMACMHVHVTRLRIP
jgi:hypothetical protein